MTGEMGNRRNMLARALTVMVAAALALPLTADDAPKAEGKGKKPRLELRSSPRMGFSPVHVLLTAEFTGGDDIEAFHCPEIEWDWDDGGKSVQEADCQPFTPGTKIERRFTADHDYRRAGVYNIKATFRRTNRQFAQASVRVTVRAGLGDPTIERDN